VKEKKPPKKKAAGKGKSTKKVVKKAKKDDDEKDEESVKPIKKFDSVVLGPGYWKKDRSGRLVKLDKDK